MRELEVPFFAEVESSRRVLIAGAGGGFDLFSGLPLYFALRAAGKEVHLASLTFSDLRMASGNWLGPKLFEVTPDVGGSVQYFPERELSRWFSERGENVTIYAFERGGVRPLARSYQALVDRLSIDTIVLADGGTDSLMRGDEVDLGTPEEDISSILAVHELAISRKILVSLGFGVDVFHGVCHALFLENVAELIRSEAYLGAFSLTRDMPAVQAFREATLAVLNSTHAGCASVVCTSILSAVDGQFGDYHATRRTAGSTLFINPLMAIYWCFRADGVAARVLYAEAARQTETLSELAEVIRAFRAGFTPIRRWKGIPL